MMVQPGSSFAELPVASGVTVDIEVCIVDADFILSLLKAQPLLADI